MQRWDIFCHIVDNHGDIGACWRLGRQLAHEHGIAIRLWVDDLIEAKQLISALDTSQQTQKIDGVEICHWREPFPKVKVANTVIEAFACDLPASYLAAMTKTKPVWLNLEYLSAEQWISESHLLASPHPTLALTKHFFFPGFTAQSGGLIRERDLIEKRDTFQSDTQAQTAFWKKLGVSGNSSLKISLFCYPYAPLSGLLKAIAGGTRHTIIYVPDSSTLVAVGGQLGIGQLMIGDHISQGNLTLQVLPFLTQDDYDHLLWACDINFVRGEDSWVRALWAAKPFVWQPYLQQQSAHLIKLKAFLDIYGVNLPTDIAEALQHIHSNWSSGQFGIADWQLLLNYLPALQTYAIEQSKTLALLPDLAAKLVIFCENFSK